MLFKPHEAKQQKILPKIFNLIRKKGLILVVVAAAYIMAHNVMIMESATSAVILVLLPMVIALVAMKPVFGISAYLFLSVTVLQFSMWGFPQSFLGMPMFLTTPILLLTLLSWLIEVIGKQERFRVIYDSNNSLMVLFWGFLLLSSLFAIPDYLSRGSSLGDYLVFANCCVVFFTIVYLIGDDIKKFFFMISAVAGIYGYYAYNVLRKAAYYGFGTDYSVTTNAAGQLADNNELAACLAISVPIFYGLFLCAKTKPRKLLFLIGSLMAVGAVIYTRSRGGLLGLGVIAAPMFFKQVIYGKKKKIVPVILAAIILLAGYGVFHEKVHSRIESIANWQEDQSAKNRIVSVIAAWEMIKDSPLFGQGGLTGIYGAAGAAGGREPFFPDFGVLIRTGFDDDDFVLIEKPSHDFVIHNAYAALGGQYGLPGLIIFVWLIFRSMKKLRGLRKEFPLNDETAWIHYISHALEISILAYATTAMFLNNPHQIFIYVIHALTSSLCYLTQQPQKKHNVGISILGLTLFAYWLYTTVGMGVMRAGG